MDDNLPKIWKPFTVHGRAYTQPIKVTRAQGIWLTLEDGRQIKDLISSWWVNLYGHAHPEIAAAISRQAQELEHVIFAGFTHQPAEDLVDKLLEMNGHHFGHAFFSDNGSTAVEVALKIAYQYWHNTGQTNRRRILTFEGAYHGDTVGAMSAGEPSVFNEPFRDWLIRFDRVPYASTWHDDTGVQDKEDHILRQIERLFTDGGDLFAAILIEPLIQGAGGMNMCRPEFLKRLHTLAAEYEVLVIYDEVMTGFGRTGDWFAWQQAATKPDIICLSKGLTAGFLPMSLSLTTTEVFRAFNHDDANKTLWHGHSYTANPLGCAAACAGLNLLPKSDLQRRSIQRIHEVEMAGLCATFPFLHRWRVRGTIAAVDIKTSERDGYFNRIAAEIKKMAPAYGLLIRPLGQVLYLMPPYCITDDELREAYKDIGRLLEEIKKALY